jgi:hypothetical protein
MACVALSDADEEEKENTPPDRTVCKNRQTFGATGRKFSANTQTADCGRASHAPQLS